LSSDQEDEGIGWGFERRPGHPGGPGVALIVLPAAGAQRLSCVEDRGAGFDFYEVFLVAQ
jgi:hypothetical protein